MKYCIFPAGYQPPYLSVIDLRAEADICAGTNEAGHGYDDDDENNNLGDL